MQFHIKHICAWIQGHVLTIIVIAMFVPAVIGVYYLCIYGFERTTPDWGALSTWYAGLLSAYLLYKTLVQQRRDNNTTAELQALNQLRENTLYMNKMLGENIRNIKGVFSYYDRKLNKNFNKVISGLPWFYCAAFELKYLHTVLSSSSIPDDVDVAIDKYNEQYGHIYPDEQESTIPEEERERRSKQRKKEHRQILHVYFLSIIAEKYKVSSSWWNKSSSKTMDDISNYTLKLFHNVHPEFDSCSCVLLQIMRNIKQTKDKFAETKMEDDYKQLANMTVASIPKETHHFLNVYSRLDKSVQSFMDDFKVGYEVIDK